MCSAVLSCSVMSNSLLLMDCSLPVSSIHGDSPGSNTGVGCYALFQGIFPTQGSNPGLLHCRQILYQLIHQGSLEKHEQGIKNHRLKRLRFQFWFCTQSWVGQLTFLCFSLFISRDNKANLRRFLQGLNWPSIKLGQEYSDACVSCYHFYYHYGQTLVKVLNQYSQTFVGV